MDSPLVDFVSGNLQLNPSSKHIEDFVKGEILYHGSIQITPFRHKEYIKKFNKNYLLSIDRSDMKKVGLIDPDKDLKKKKFNIDNPGFVSQGYLFNVGFGLSVHDISFNAIANLSYKNLKYGSPVFEGDILYAKSEVLGIEVKKDGASNGSVQVKTVITNQRDEVVLEYVRQVLVRTRRGVTIDAQTTTEEQPSGIDINEINIPLQYKDLNREFNFPRDTKVGGDTEVIPGKVVNFKTFEEFKEGEIYEGNFSKAINLVDFSWLQISTLNDASIHHTPSSNFIGYGGAVKSLVEGEVSHNIPYAYFLGMNSGSHDAPTYPIDIVQSSFNSDDDDDEKIIGSFEVKEKIQIKDRDDCGVLKIELRGDKIVTKAGLRAYEKTGFKGITKIQDNLIRVLTMEMLIAVPTKGAYK
ncbi:MAG: hypothetical protein VX343_01235 [Thermodesulfobacteriota bacterium]|nr:hypothetical protein [Thermodesulfobacteriota bacterium]